MNTVLNIGGRKVGPGHPTYVVAEMSGNHNGDFDRAVRLLQAAKESGADAIKLQTYTADTLTIPCDNEHFRISSGTPWDGMTLHDLYQEASTPWEWQPRLKEVADRLGLPLFSSPFDGSAVDFLETLGVPAHKIASFEMVDHELVRRVVRTGKPVIMSTGMAEWNEIEEAVEVVRSSGGKELALLKCTSAYPAPPEEMNLRAIPRLAEHFGIPVGLSDHTLGSVVPTAAVALGACIIEKHLTLARRDPGPDAHFSLEPAEFRDMVAGIRMIEKAMGSARWAVGETEARSRVFRRSLFTVKPIRAGERLTRENVRSIRPGYGLAPKHLEEVLRRSAAVDIPRGTPLRWELLT
jgi:N-acetylneuraminate synthase